MTDASDMDLVREFARNRSEVAFAELVRRHLNLVYSAARRCTDSESDAQDVAQTVFVLLARKAAGLPARTVLPGWLYETARFSAACLRRTNARRRDREQEAFMQSTLTEAANPAADWHRLAPHLEAAMSQLGESDRALLVLRFYGNKTGPEAAALLGLQEAATHKRTARALEKLRKFFHRRGITLSAAAIAGAISAHSVQAAPAGLAAAITATALSGTAITTAALIAATKAIAMTTLQKTILAILLTTAAGVSVYATKEAAHDRAGLWTLRQQQAGLAEQNRQLQSERDDATNRLAGLLAEIARLKSNPNQYELLKLRGEVTQFKTAQADPANQTAKNWLNKLNRLKQRLEDNPAAKIPEFQYLTDQDWLDAANRKLDTDTDYRQAFAALRNAAENRFGSQIETAVQKYIQSSGSSFPTDLAQLQTFFNSPVDDSILQRWQITSAQTAPNLGLGDPIITQKAAVDDLFDTRVAIGPSGFGSSDFLSSEIKSTLGPVYQAFMAANNGQEPTSQSQLQPYATTAEQQALLQKVMQKESLVK